MNPSFERECKELQRVIDQQDRTRAARERVIFARDDLIATAREICTDPNAPIMLRVAVAALDRAEAALKAPETAEKDGTAYRGPMRDMPGADRTVDGTPGTGRTTKEEEDQT